MTAAIWSTRINTAPSSAAISRCASLNPAITDGSKLLLIRDSYSDSLAPFLAQRFSEVHLVDLRYYHTSVADYMAEQGIDTAVVLYSVSNFITDRNLIYLATRG